MVLMAEGDGVFLEYAGGYSDMVAQRGHGVAPRESGIVVPADRAKRRTAPKEKREADAPRRKLGFNDAHALKTLPARIAALEKNIAALSERLSDPAFYGRDAKAFAETTTALEAARAELAACEERWLELEILREEIEGK